MGVLEISQVTKWYRGERAVLERLDLTVEKGSALSIIGCGGSGASTLFQILSGQVRQDEGSVEWKGKPAFVFDALPRTRGVTVAQYGEAVGFLQKTDRRERQEAFLEALIYFGIEKRRGQTVNSLNAYEACLVMFALARMQRPDIVVMDQWQKYVSESQESRLWSYVKQWVKEEGFALVCFSDTEILENFFDKKQRLKNGKLEER